MGGSADREWKGAIDLPEFLCGRAAISRAAPIALRTVKESLEAGAAIERVFFICFSEADLEVYLDNAPELLGV